jgi:hypothetical protein
MEWCTDTVHVAGVLLVGVLQCLGYQTCSAGRQFAMGVLAALWVTDPSRCAPPGLWPATCCAVIAHAQVWQAEGLVPS